MLPLSDGIPARRFPIVNVPLIVANFAVFIFYELPQLNAAVYHASFYPCAVDNACHGPEPWVDLPDLPGPDPGLDLPRAVVLVPAHRGELRAVQRLGERGGVAFFAHVGGFIFGLLVARLLARTGQTAPGEQWRSTT
jgi:hypothetical protein